MELDDGSLPRRLGGSLAQAGGELYRDAAVTVYSRDEDGTWTVAAQ